MNICEHFVQISVPVCADLWLRQRKYCRIYVRLLRCTFIVCVTCNFIHHSKCNIRRIEIAFYNITVFLYKDLPNIQLQGPSLAQTMLNYTPLVVRNCLLVIEFVRLFFSLVRVRSNLFLPSVNTSAFSWKCIFEFIW